MEYCHPWNQWNFCHGSKAVCGPHIYKNSFILLPHRLYSTAVNRIGVSFASFADNVKLWNASRYNKEIITRQIDQYFASCKNTIKWQTLITYFIWAEILIWFDVRTLKWQHVLPIYDLSQRRQLNLSASLKNIEVKQRGFQRIMLHVDPKLIDHARRSMQQDWDEFE